MGGGPYPIYLLRYFRDFEARRLAMTRDWQDGHAYDEFDAMDLSGLAWECLRRNHRYRKEYPLMDRGLASAASWGLRFPGRSG